MERSEQQRTIGGFLFVFALLATVAAVGGAVALASGSGSTSSPDSSTPGTSDDGGGPPIASPGETGRDCPDQGGGSTTPSTPATTDGSTNFHPLAKDASPPSLQRRRRLPTPQIARRHVTRQ